MDQAVQERTYKIKHDIPASLRAIADRLGQSNAGPRDVVEMHAAALRNRLAALPQQSRAYAEEGRLLALELMGHLVSFYRNRSMGGPH